MDDHAIPVLEQSEYFRDRLSDQSFFFFRITGLIPVVKVFHVDLMVLNGAGSYPSVSLAKQNMSV